MIRYFFRFKFIRRILAISAVAAASLCAITLTAEVIASELMWRAHRNGQSLQSSVDAAIVLGASMDPDGKLAWNSRRRVQAGVYLLKSGKTRSLIFSGRGPGFDFLPVGRLMFDYAVELGARPDELYIEEQAGTTIQNLEFSFQIADKIGAGRIALVSDAFHLTRAWALASAMGRTDISLASVDHRRWHWRHDVPMMHMREALAWWYNLGKVALWHQQNRRT